MNNGGDRKRAYRRVIYLDRLFGPFLEDATDGGYLLDHPNSTVVAGCVINIMVSGFFPRPHWIASNSTGIAPFGQTLAEMVSGIHSVELSRIPKDKPVMLIVDSLASQGALQAVLAEIGLGLRIAGMFCPCIGEAVIDALPYPTVTFESPINHLASRPAWTWESVHEPVEPIGQFFWGELRLVTRNPKELTERGATIAGFGGALALSGYAIDAVVAIEGAQRLGRMMSCYFGLVNPLKHVIWLDEIHAPMIHPDQPLRIALVVPSVDVPGQVDAWLKCYNRGRNVLSLVVCLSVNRRNVVSSPIKIVSLEELIIEKSLSNTGEHGL